MGRFKTSINFTVGEKLATVKGVITDWTFVREDSKNPKTGRRYAIATCKCGREKRVCINNIRNGTSTCCGYTPCRGKIQKKDPEVGHRAIMYVYKKHARERNLVFQLAPDYFKELTQKCCSYCGIEPMQIYQLKNPKTGNIRSGIPILYNGIDRLDSSKGYTKDNVVTCCKVCNRAKSDMPLTEFTKWIKRIYLKTIKT